MYYREFTSMSRRSCRGFRNGPDLIIFGSYEIGKIKGFFSQYERYNDSDVLVSVRPSYYDLTITVTSDLDKGDSWCNYKLREAMDYVKDLITDCCRADSTPLEITIKLYTA